jgi:hypothetical protein
LRKPLRFFAHQLLSSAESQFMQNFRFSAVDFLLEHTLCKFPASSKSKPHGFMEPFVYTLPDKRML